MSAYIVDPRTIDYLVTWAINKREIYAYVSDEFGPTEYDHVRTGQRFDLRQLTPNQLGQILLDENVRSVQARYPDDRTDNLPSPCDQSRIFAYRFQPVGHQLAPWVISSCDCLHYQSCETSDYEQTLGHAVMRAIRESAIKNLTIDAPWGVTDSDIAEHKAKVIAKMGLRVHA